MVKKIPVICRFCVGERAGAPRTTALYVNREGESEKKYAHGKLKVGMYFVCC